MLCTSALAQLQLLHGEEKQFKQSKLQRFIITDTHFISIKKYITENVLIRQKQFFMKVNTSMSQTGRTCRRIEAMNRRRGSLGTKSEAEC